MYNLNADRRYEVPLSQSVTSHYHTPSGPLQPNGGDGAMEGMAGLLLPLQPPPVTSGGFRPMPTGSAPAAAVAIA